jgi:gamma-glutamylcyclotransferase (GGCT)/AIG2-like uncharacterized protein YtfP
MDEHRGLRYFRWNTSGEEVHVDVLTSRDLPNELARLDHFEGRGYVRTLVPVTVNGGLRIANIYEAADRPRGGDA